MHRYLNRLQFRQNIARVLLAVLIGFSALALLHFEGSIHKMTEYCTAKNNNHLHYDMQACSACMFVLSPFSFIDETQVSNANDAVLKNSVKFIKNPLAENIMHYLLRAPPFAFYI